jgi:hypothetical protein
MVKQGGSSHSQRLDQDLDAMEITSRKKMCTTARDPETEKRRAAVWNWIHP